MEDITGLGKMMESAARLADSQLAIKTYDDFLADAMREGGKTLADTVKAFRLFTAPLQLLAVAQDRLAAYCDRVRSKVPQDRQQEAIPSVALPVLMALRFMEDDNPLTELYLNLLARAIDKERYGEAHPAFAKIIEQLCPDEAMIMYHFRDRNAWMMPPSLERGVWSHCFPILSLVDPNSFRMYADHLVALNLLKPPTEDIEVEPRFDMPAKTTRRSDETLRVTRFGKSFIKACVPQDFTLKKTKAEEK